MFDSKNILYILTMLEAIEKILIYLDGFEDKKKLYIKESLKTQYYEELYYLKDN